MGGASAAVVEASKPASDDQSTQSASVGIPEGRPCSIARYCWLNMLVRD